MKKVSLIVIIFVFQLFSFGQELSLEQAVDIALERNQQIKRARNQTQIATNNSHPGQADLLPTVSLQGSHQNSQISPSQGVESNRSISSANIRASYTLFNGFQNINQYQKLQSQESLTRTQTRRQIEEVILRVIKTYYKVAESVENLNAQQTALDISKSRKNRIQERKKLGQADSLDLLSATVAYNRDSINVVKAQQSLTEAKRDFNQILNRDISTSFQINTEVDFYEFPKQDTLEKIAYNNNAEYLIAQNDLELANINQDIARSSYFPELEMTGSYGYNKETQELGFYTDDPNRNWNIGFSLNFNIFNGFRRNIANQNAKIRVNSSQLAVKESQRQLQKYLSNALERLNNNKQVLQMERDNLKSARLNFERTQEAYQLGQVTSTRFREAQLDLIKARQGISQAKYNAKISESRVLQIIGNLLSDSQTN